LRLSKSPDIPPRVVAGIGAKVLSADAIGSWKTPGSSLNAALPGTGAATRTSYGDRAAGRPRKDIRSCQLADQPARVANGHRSVLTGARPGPRSPFACDELRRARGSGTAAAPIPGPGTAPRPATGQSQGSIGDDDVAGMASSSDPAGAGTAIIASGAVPAPLPAHIGVSQTS